MKTLAGLALVAISFALPSARAADQVVMFGAGTKGCGEYLDGRRQSNKAADLAEVATVPIATVLAFLDPHCREHPADAVSSGVEALIRAKQK